MKRRWWVILVVAGALCAGYFFTASPQSQLTVANGKATQMGAGGEMFMVTLDLQNDGDPVILESVSSPSGAQATFMNPGQDGPLVAPGGDSAKLAMDGAHIMLQVAPDAFPEGGFQSLTLTLSDGSAVAARILRPETTGATPAMDHSLANGVEMSPSPTIALAREPAVSADGFDVEISVENFEFVRVEDGAPHVEGQGHAHIYLNGLKLGRLYGAHFSVGSLAPGDYVLTVALNSNDHRPYLSDGAPVMLTYRFSL